MNILTLGPFFYTKSVALLEVLSIGKFSSPPPNVAVMQIPFLFVLCPHTELTHLETKLKLFSASASHGGIPIWL